ncbi:MAG: MBL fold metallo-hydrolase [Gemmatimonadaceae bacterium]|nr:MBL fold metallo-hydrolase [Gemmatimonadaceae bacterium]
MPRVHIRTPVRHWRRCGVALLLLLSSCRWLSAGDPAPFAPTPAAGQRVLSFCASVCADSVDVVALGVDGYLIVPWRDTTRLVMTPPSYSNPSLWHLALRDWWWGTRPNTARIAAGLAAVPTATARLTQVRAVLVGHGHYDHALDLPSLLPRLPHATVYGSATVAHLLRPAVGTAAGGVVAVTPGQAVPIGPVLRAQALAWGHAPNVAGWTLAPGRYTTDRTTLPRTVHGWRMGEPLAWSIDILGRDGSVALRLFYHDAAASLDIIRAAVAELQRLPHAAHTVVVLSAANWDQHASYPAALLASLEPDHVLFGHWEDFFRSPSARPKVVRGINARELVQEFERYVGPRWSVLAPGATLRIRLGK